MSENTAVIKILSREDILAATDITRELVQVPEWGGAVYVKALSGFDRDRYEQSLLQGKGKNRDLNLRNARAKLVALTVVNEEGQRIFSDDDVLALGTKSAAALTRVFDVAQRLSGLTDEDLEELSKNSVNDQSASFGLTSR
jgi:hypothetical protein